MSGGVLRFRAAGLLWGVFLAEVGRVVVEDGLLAVPFSHPAMAGLLVAGADGPVPVFDLRGLVDDAAPALPLSRARTVALFPTARGPVGLRLEELLGTVDKYTGLDAQSIGALHKDVASALLRTMTGAARGIDGDMFSFFSPDAFLAELGLSPRSSPF